MTRNEGAGVWTALKNQISEAVFLLDGEGRVLDANAAAGSLLLRSSQELLGACLSSLLGEPLSSLVSLTNPGFLSSTPAEGEVTCPGPDGKMKTLSYVLLRLLAETEEGQDIAKTKEIKKEEKEESQAKGCLILRDETERLSLLATASSLEEQGKKLELQNQFLEETFGRYFSDSLLKTLLDTPGGLSLGGRRQELTILMSDLRGFTMVSESLPPEGLISLLNHYLGEMTEVIQGRGGTIIEFIGDGIMALFGAPIRRETHAQEAVAAAIEMQGRMKEVNAWNKERGFPSLEMGIGVHTGEAILGNIGSEKRMKYGVVGDCVNVAGRIESYTVGGQVLISDYTRRKIDVPLKLVRNLEVLPKGMSSPLLLHQVSAIGKPYDASYSLPEEGLVPLRIPQIVRFSRTEGKRRGREVYAGQVRARSAREFLLFTGEMLEDFENLIFQVPGEKDFYGKVMGRRPGGWLVHRTSV